MSMNSASGSGSSHASKDDGFTEVKHEQKLKRKSQKGNSSGSGDEQTNKIKKGANFQLQPVILEATDKSKPLACYSPVTVDRCLRRSIGQYDSCKLIKNGNSIVKCQSGNQIETLLNQDSISENNGTCISVSASLIKPVGVKGVIYNVPLNITSDELLWSLNRKLRLSKDLNLKLTTLAQTLYLMTQKQLCYNSVARNYQIRCKLVIYTLM